MPKVTAIHLRHLARKLKARAPSLARSASVRKERWKHKLAGHSIGPDSVLQDSVLNSDQCCGTENHPRQTYTSFTSKSYCHSVGAELPVTGRHALSLDLWFASFNEGVTQMQAWRGTTSHDHSTHLKRGRIRRRPLTSRHPPFPEPWLAPLNERATPTKIANRTTPEQLDHNSCTMRAAPSRQPLRCSLDTGGFHTIQSAQKCGNTCNTGFVSVSFLVSRPIGSVASAPVAWSPKARPPKPQGFA